MVLLIRKVAIDMLQTHNALLAALGLYPFNTKDQDAAAVQEKVARIAAANPYVLQMNDFCWDRTEKTMRFDLVVSFVARDRRNVCREVCKAVQKEYPDHTLNVALDDDLSAERGS